MATALAFLFLVISAAATITTLSYVAYHLDTWIKGWREASDRSGMFLIGFVTPFVLALLWATTYALDPSIWS